MTFAAFNDRLVFFWISNMS